MFRVVVTSEGGGQYAKRCTRETSRALADAVTFSASWAAAHAADVSERVSKRAGEDAFEATARWCASALANGGASFVNALMSAHECGGVVRFANIMTACERASCDAARRELRLPCLAARLYLLRAAQAFADESTSEADAAMKRAIADDKTDDFVAGGALDRAVAATAAGDATAFVFATARLRAAFAGVGFARARDDANDENQPSKKKPKKSRVALR
jgi:nucleolar pre-ribosomal-associated protein 1